MSVPTGGLTFSDVRTELVSERFGAGLVSQVNRWINMRYGMVWGDSEWPFKRVRREQWTATTTTPTMPPAYWKTTRLERPSGTVVRYLEPDEFDNTHPVGEAGSGSSDDYTVINGQVYLGFVPDGGLVHSYERRPCHYDNGDAVIPGLMAADTDYPLWPPEWHYALVLGATATGLKVQNDPTWDSVEQEFGALMLAMREDLLPPDQYGNSQYGRDTLG